MPEILGTIHLDKETEHYDHNYQVAAWWRRIMLLPGDYPVVVDAHSPMYATVLVNARIEEEYFPSLWGGVPVETGNDRRYAHQGEATTLLVTAHASHIRERILNDDEPIHWLGGMFTRTAEEK